jgi:regulatory protein
VPSPSPDPEALALALLGRREHSRAELRGKLRGKGVGSEAAEAVLDRLSAQGWLDENRFVETYVAERQRRGFGPLKIRQALRERGVDAALIDDALEGDAESWHRTLDALCARRLGDPATLDERRAYARAVRFLTGRGFPQGWVIEALKRFRSDANRAFHADEGAALTEFDDRS